MTELDGGRTEFTYRGFLSIYYNCFVENDYSDIWYYWDGKPLLYAESCYENAVKNVDKDSRADQEALDKIKDFFTIRRGGQRDGQEDVATGSDKWVWLENFPQVLRNKDASGRPEFVSLGVGINESTFYGKTRTGVFSDEYSKGRAYSEVFGEDNRETGTRNAYFFREQAALVLEAATKFVLID